MNANTNTFQKLLRRYNSNLTFLNNHFAQKPLKFLNNVTPYEKIHGISPINNHFRACGCLACVFTPKPNRKKMQPRANPYVFLGHPFAQKA